MVSTFSANTKKMKSVRVIEIAIADPLKTTKKWNNWSGGQAQL